MKPFMTAEELSFAEIANDNLQPFLLSVITFHIELWVQELEEEYDEYDDEYEGYEKAYECDVVKWDIDFCQYLDSVGRPVNGTAFRIIIGESFWISKDADSLAKTFGQKPESLEVIIFKEGEIVHEALPYAFHQYITFGGWWKRQTQNGNFLIFNLGVKTPVAFYMTPELELLDGREDALNEVIFSHSWEGVESVQHKF